MVPQANGTGNSVIKEAPWQAMEAWVRIRQSSLSG